MIGYAIVSESNKNCTANYYYSMRNSCKSTIGNETRNSIMGTKPNQRSNTTKIESVGLPSGRYTLKRSSPTIENDLDQPPGNMWVLTNPILYMNGFNYRSRSRYNPCKMHATT